MPRTKSMLLAALLASSARGDVYLQHPRGSNNKLNEVSNTVKNDNRLFDSQNNGNAGYQVGDACDPVCSDSDGNYDESAAGAAGGQPYYHTGSVLALEWTSQHGCGNGKVRCEHVLQYACGDTLPGLRDGSTTATVPDDAAAAADAVYGLHETYAYYQDCAARERNRGLWVADQSLSGRDTALFTRQARAGTRFGFECPEERDYYPYWHPTPWRDVAVFVDDEDRCGYYRRESENVKGRGFCADAEHNNAARCADAESNWATAPARGTAPPQCLANPYTRANHHGNVAGGSSMQGFNWTIPANVQGTCVLRLRYNVSTADFDAWRGFSTSATDSAIDASYNGAQQSPVTTDPTANFAGFEKEGEVDFKFKLNVDTSQFPRTFQDRSHTFRVVRNRPAGVAAGARIFNLGVRGRRGNIVQTYPSVEYDFVPQHLTVDEGDYVHFQWTGSDANPTGNAGNGRMMTDRSNLVEAKSGDVSFPLDLSGGASMFEDEADRKRMAYLGQAVCDADSDDDQDVENCKVLNAAPAYFDGGVVQMAVPGAFAFLSTRNNDFTNREHKGDLTVRKKKKRTPAWASTAAGAATLAAVAVLAAGGAAAAVAARRHVGAHPSGTFAASRVGKWFVFWFELDAFQRVELCGERSIYGRAALWWLFDSQLFLWSAAFAADVAAVFVYGMASNWSGAGLYYPYAKGAGNVLNVLMAAIFLPMCRNILTFLRSTDIARCVPLYHAAAFHKFLAFAVLVVTAVRAGCHYADFAWKARRSGPSVAASAGSFESASGHAILALVVIMSLTSRDGVRRAKFKVGRRAAGWFSSSWAAATSAARTVGGHTIFWVAHHLWVVVVLLMLAHAQHFWLWVAWPLARFLLDKAISARRADLDVVIIRVAEPPKDVVHLDLRLASGRALKYKPGQFVFINCPEISQRKWHPFTLSSSPEQRTHFSVHIRCQSTLDWCHALRNHLRAAVSENDAGDDGGAPRESCVAPPPPPQTPPPPAARRPSGTAARARGGKDAAAATWEVRTTLEGNKYEVDVETGETRWCTGAAVAGVARCLPVVKVDGPYGAPAEAVYDYSVLVLVGAGIGITPFASILKTIAIQKRNKTEETPIERVYLNWICRDVAEFDSFAALLDDIKNDAALKPFFDLSIYITGELRLKDVCPKTTGGLNSFAGRPNWNRIFKEVAAAHCEAQREIGVFFCGPSAIGNQLSVACRMFTTLKTRGGTKFVIHSENF